MSYQFTREGEIIIDNFDKGIASSPHQGIANMQNVNIATEQGEVMASFARTLQTQANTTASITLTPLSTSTFSSSVTMTNGVWLHIASSTIPGFATGNYYVINKASPSGNNFQLSTTYGGSAVTFTQSGTASGTLLVNFSNPVDYATEIYSDGSTTQYRYYVLDAAGYVWVNDSALNASNINWFLPDTGASPSSGIAVLNGWLFIFRTGSIACKSTSLLGNGFSTFGQGNGLLSSSNHDVLVGHQGKLYYTDGNYIGSVFPNTSLLTGAQNIQSYAKYTAVTTTCTIATLIGGSKPTTSTASTRIPAVFFTSGTLPTAITADTIYYIDYNGATFGVYAASSGGAALDMQTGSAGNQYYNTFYPIHANGFATITYTPQRLNLPFYETAQCLAEIGNNIMIGCVSNVLYPWNQIDVTPFDILPLPEANVVNMVTVNNMAYIFAGNKGNIYVTNGNTATAVISVPDYTAGVPGTPTSYIEPYFTWGGGIYCRGRIYFSILDQTATKAGNCGGIWSFVPTQNMFIGQDTGLSLRLENQSSYRSYNGYAPILIAAYNQAANGTQYWSAWKSSISSPTYGIDFTDTLPSGDTPAIIETDLIPTGTVLNKKTFSQIEYKLSTPLVGGETVTISYRQNSTDAWTSCGTVNTETSTDLSGYFSVNFEKGQWLQLRISLNSLMISNASFIRLRQIIVR